MYKGLRENCANQRQMEICPRILVQETINLPKNPMLIAKGKCLLLMY